LPSKIHNCVWKRGAIRIFKIFIFLLKINFFYILDCFDTLISKIILKKYHFDAFWHGKRFEKQSQPYSQTIVFFYP